MANENNTPVAENYFLKPGFLYVADKPTAISTVVGSCVAISLYDRHRLVCGTNHFQYPFIGDKHKATARYGNVAVSALIEMMLQNGSKLKHLEAQIFGGAHNADISPQNIGRENVGVARKVITRKKIPIVSEDVGGQKGRKVIINTDMNQIVVVKVDKLRVGDWYPYANRR
jgi:chemotaxis protein CheD